MKKKIYIATFIAVIAILFNIKYTHAYTYNCNILLDKITNSTEHEAVDKLIEKYGYENYKIRRSGGSIENGLRPGGMRFPTTLTYMGFDSDSNSIKVLVGNRKNCKNAQRGSRKNLQW